MATDKTECDEDLKEKFQILKFQLSKHYNGRYFKWLRFCLHGYIQLEDLDRDDVTAMSLFNELQRTGEITPRKVRLLLNIANLTGFSEAVGQIDQYMADNNVQLVDEETLAASRKQLFKMLRQIGQDELKNVIHNYDELNKFEFTNIWDAVFVLDKENRLGTPSRITRFTDCLGKSAHDDRQGEMPTSSNENQGTRQEVKSETGEMPTSSNEKQGTKRNVKSETVEVSTTSNEEQGTQNKVESETEKIQTYLIKIQKEKCRQASTFTPATMNDRYKVDISQMFTDMELLKERENNKGSKPTTLEEVVDVISSTPGCRALIEGEGGIGKTTIIRHLSYIWATPNQSNNVFEGKIVFFLCVRDLQKDDNIFDLIVKQLDMKDFNLDTDLPKDPRLIQKFIKKHDGKVVLLLDGLDELRFDNQSVLSLFNKTNLKESTVILTSRPENIDEFKRECNVHVRVKGFNQESIWEYIEKYFNYFGQPQLGDSLKRELGIDTRYYYRKHPEAYSMCKNPMLLLSICMLWEDNQSLPSDSADLFKQLFRSILNQFNKQVAKISKFEDIPANYVNAMILLGKCMYKSLKKNQLSINMTDLNDTHSTRDMIDMAVNLGFVYEEAPISKSSFERIFMPPHKLIVESLVGFYLCKLCESDGIENECTTEDVRRILTPLDDNEWKVIRESEHLKMGRKFAIGFLGANANAFLKHWVTNSLSTYRSLPSNLMFVKEQHKDAVVNELNDQIQDLEIKTHLDNISTSIKMFIDHISPGVQCNGHFIRLIMQLYGMAYDKEPLKYYAKGNKSLNTFCSKMALKRKGKVIAHILGIEAKCKSVFIDQYLSRDVFHDFVSECSLKQVQLALRHLDISCNNLRNIDVNSMSSLLIMSPKLRWLDMRNCNLSGDVINHLVTECSVKQVQLALRELNISANNLHNIDVNSMSSLLIMCPKLRTLYMWDCNLSSEVINYLTTTAEERLKRDLSLLYRHFYE